MMRGLKVVPPDGNKNSRLVLKSILHFFYFDFFVQRIEIKLTSLNVKREKEEC